MNIEKTIEENIGLVQKMASKFYTKNPVYCIEDLVQVGVLNLLKALPQYDKNRAKLSTFISHCAKTSIMKFVNKNRDSNKVNTASFDCVANSKNGFFSGHVVGGNNLSYNDDIDIKNFISDHNAKTQKILKLKIAGKSQKQIKEETGVSEAEIRRTLNKIKNELMGVT